MLIEGIAGRVMKVAGNVANMLTQYGSLRVAQLEGEGDEATRAGFRFHMSALGATGIAPVQAIPSTAAQWAIFNPQGSTVTAYLDVLGMVLISGTAGAGGTLLWCPLLPAFVPATVPTVSAANVKITNANSVSSRTSSLIVVASQTLQNAAAGNWAPMAFMNPAGTILGQTQMEQRDIRGKIAIPPNSGIGLAVISPTGTTPLFGPYASWREYASDNE